jgi:hypothetical protein
MADFDILASPFYTGQPVRAVPRPVTRPFEHRWRDGDGRLRKRRFRTRQELHGFLASLAPEEADRGRR